MDRTENSVRFFGPKCRATVILTFVSKNLQNSWGDEELLLSSTMQLGSLVPLCNECASFLSHFLVLDVKNFENVNQNIQFPSVSLNI